MVKKVMLGFVVLLILATVPVHEMLHRETFDRFGCDSEYRWTAFNDKDVPNDVFIAVKGECEFQNQETKFFVHSLILMVHIVHYFTFFVLIMLALILFVLVDHDSRGF